MTAHASVPRYDMYRLIHKGVRAFMAEMRAPSIQAAAT